MKYYQHAGTVYGYDPADPTQTGLIQTAVAAGWTDVTASWPPASSAPPLATQAMALAVGGLTVTCTSGGFTATFASDEAAQSHMAAEMLSVLANTTFADGSSTLAWPDTAGAVHTFPSVASGRAFFVSMGAFVAACYKVANGVTTTLPSTSVTVP